MAQSGTWNPSVTPPPPLIDIGRSREGAVIVEFILLLLLQQQQDELDDDGPLTQSPYVGEGRRRRDRRVPRPALRHPRLSPWTQLLNLANDQALITSCGIDFDSFLTLLA